MNLIIFTVYDEKAQTFMPPFPVQTSGLAVRAFKDCINSKDHQFGKHPADYTLFQLGSFDDQTCQLDFTDKISLGNGVEFLSNSHVSAIEEFQHGQANPPILPDQNR